MIYRNKKAILVCGYSRGGTNIVWNLLQSHPQITTPIFETGKLFNNSSRPNFRRVISVLKKLSLMDSSLAKMIIDYELHRYKLLTLQHSENRYKNPEERYTKREVSESSICLKSVDDDIYLTDLLLNVYPDLFIIFVVRNGYAVAEGHIRRGANAEEVGRLYTKIYKNMKETIEHHPRTMLIKFEDAIHDPFGTSKKLLKFCEFENDELDYLRLKSKITMTKSGDHNYLFGVKDSKYWFDKDSIHEIIVKDVNRNQIERLDKSMIDTINKVASEALIYFGYDLINQVDLR